MESYRHLIHNAGSDIAKVFGTFLNNIPTDPGEWLSIWGERNHANPNTYQASPEPFDSSSFLPKRALEMRPQITDILAASIYTGIKLYSIDYHNWKEGLYVTFLDPVSSKSKAEALKIINSSVNIGRSTEVDKFINDYSGGRLKNYSDLDELLGDIQNVRGEAKGIDRVLEMAVVEMGYATETLDNTLTMIAENFLLLGSDDPIEDAIGFLEKKPSGIFSQVADIHEIESNLELIAQLAGNAALARINEAYVVPEILQKSEVGKIDFHPKTFSFLQKISGETMGGCPVVGHDGFPIDDSSETAPHT